MRISGPAALATLDALATPRPSLRRAAVRTLRDPTTGALLDQALVLAFAAPGSATGEDVVELHLHGGPAVVAAVLGVLGQQPRLRLAEPGEFMRRGFDNGRVDLSQAEGLADLIAAETDTQRLAALDQAGGRLRSVVERWRDALIMLCAETEAELDFAEEEADVAAGLGAGTTAALDQLRTEIGAAIADSGRGQRTRDGLTIAVLGAPNTGKSSLINALSGCDSAIVSEHAGTTRDIIALPLDLGGVAVTMFDTAGLRETSDPVETEGIRRARARAASADLVLHVATSPTEAALGQVVINKIDQSGMPAGVRDCGIYVSALTGAGLADLEAWLTDWAQSMVRPGEPVLVTQARHAAALAAAAADLDRARDQLDAVLRAESLRMAARALARITGRVGVEDVLDAIFSRFCVGK